MFTYIHTCMHTCMHAYIHAYFICTNAPQISNRQKKPQLFFLHDATCWVITSTFFWGDLWSMDQHSVYGQHCLQLLPLQLLHYYVCSGQLQCCSLLLRTSHNNARITAFITSPSTQLRTASWHLGLQRSRQLLELLMARSSWE